MYCKCKYTTGNCLHAGISYGKLYCGKAPKRWEGDPFSNLVEKMKKCPLKPEGE